MQITYSDIQKYWNSNRCAGGNPKFPFWYWKGKQVLEIGAGIGIDAKRFIKSSAHYTGIDLVEKLSLVQEMNAEYLQLPNNYFDLVYSWGVIHHTINPERVINEIYRVLKPDGHICIMLYNKFSFRYLIEIMFLRKILWWLHYKKYNFLRKQNSNPSKEQWISWNTDTLGCPLARVYNLSDVKKLLNKFIITKTWTENWGWFRIICGRKK